MSHLRQSQTKSVIDYVGAIRTATVRYQSQYPTVALQIAPTLIANQLYYTTGVKVSRLCLLRMKSVSDSSLTNCTYVNRQPILFTTGVNATLLRLSCNEIGCRLT